MLQYVVQKKLTVKDAVKASAVLAGKDKMDKTLLRRLAAMQLADLKKGAA